MAQDGPTSGGAIVRIGPSTFNLSAIGTYMVLFQVSIDEAGQLILTLNGIDLTYTAVGRATGTSQIASTNNNPQSNSYIAKSGRQFYCINDYSCCSLSPRILLSRNLPNGIESKSDTIKKIGNASLGGISYLFTLILSRLVY